MYGGLLQISIEVRAHAMSTATTPDTTPTIVGSLVTRGLPPSLEPGDHLTRAEFERRYSARPDIKKAELIEGVVYMPSPARYKRHGKPDRHVSGWLAVYEAATPGVDGANNCTVRLDLDNEPQPDHFLRIATALGGQSSTSDDDYVEGAPELIAEVTASSVSYYMHEKLHAYRRNGVREYVVVLTEESRVLWLVLRDGEFVPLAADAAGIFRSEVFSGLWLDAAALLAGNISQVLAVLQQGVATPEHAAFAQRLAAAGNK
jgi:Uma2 family endonuclease